MMIQGLGDAQGMWEPIGCPYISWGWWLSGQAAWRGGMFRETLVGIK